MSKDRRLERDLSLRGCDRSHASASTKDKIHPSEEDRDHIHPITDRSDLENGLGPVLKTLEDEILELMANDSRRVITIVKMAFMVKDV